MRRALVGVVGALALSVAVPATATAMPMPGAEWRPVPPSKVVSISRIDTLDPVFFITIDDGITKESDVVSWVRQTKTPITAFLSENVTGASPASVAYFNAVTKYGSVQNHTHTHPFLTDPSTNIRWQVCGIQRPYAQRYGARPWMLRPPYGNGGWSSDPLAQRQRIADAVGPCGIKYVVNWYALVSNEGRFASQSGTSRIYPGDIVLLHFTPGLRDRLAALVQRGKASGLRPANLADYLPRPKG